MSLSDHLGFESFACATYCGLVQPEDFQAALDRIGPARIAGYGPASQPAPAADAPPLTYEASCWRNADGSLRIRIEAHLTQATNRLRAGHAQFYWKDGTPKGQEILNRIIGAMPPG